jgi:hypothetical protein
METLAYMKKIATAAGLCTLLLIFSCQPTRQGQDGQTRQQQTEAPQDGQASANEGLGDAITDTWNNLETQIDEAYTRADNALNRNTKKTMRSLRKNAQRAEIQLDRYYNAIERGAEQEAENLRSGLNNLFNEIEEDLQELRAEDRDNETERPN